MPTCPVLKLETSVLNCPTSHGNTIARASNSPGGTWAGGPVSTTGGPFLPAECVWAISYFLLVTMFVCASLYNINITIIINTNTNRQASRFDGMRPMWVVQVHNPHESCGLHPENPDLSLQSPNLGSHPAPDCFVPHP